MLFVPGSTPHRFGKALDSGADCVCIDLEDAVADDRKSEARQHLLRFVAERAGRSGAGIAVRINGPGTPEHEEDLIELGPSMAAFCRLLVPKVECAAQVDTLVRSLPADKPSLVGLIETPTGVANAPAIVAAMADDDELMLGGADLTTRLGARFAWEPLLFARSALVMAAAVKSLRVWDVPYLNFRDPAGLAEETERVKSLGFSGKAAIHPAQVATINETFMPSADEIARARRVIAANDAAGGGATSIDGQLVDEPVLQAARRVLGIVDFDRGHQ